MLSKFRIELRDNNTGCFTYITLPGFSKARAKRTAMRLHPSTTATNAWKV